jgi:hypothetical protein
MKYPLLVSQENKLLHLQIYITLNIIFVCEILLFDVELHFLHNFAVS